MSKYMQSPASMAPAAGGVFTSSAARLGGLAALIAASGAAASAYREVKKGTMTREEGVMHTVRESAGTGVSTAAAAAVVGGVGLTGVVGVASMVGVAAVAKYFWDGYTRPGTCCCGSHVEEAAEQAAKPAAKAAPKTKKAASKA